MGEMDPRPDRALEALRIPLLHMHDTVSAETEPWEGWCSNDVLRKSG